MATYHKNTMIKWSDSNMAYNGMIAYSSGTAYHANGLIAYSFGIAYHDNGLIAFSSGVFYNSNGRIVDNKSFSIGLGRGIDLEIIPSIKITVYGRRIN